MAENGAWRLGKKIKILNVEYFIVTKKQLKWTRKLSCFNVVYVSINIVKLLSEMCVGFENEFIPLID